MTGFEIGLLITVVIQATTIGVVSVLLYKKYVQDGLVCLEPRKDKLKVKYFWLSVEFKGEPTADDLIQSERDYEYMVEGTEIIVSKEGSFFVTSETGEVETEDTGSAHRAIRPPAGLRRPPATLMAIEISVVP